MGEVRNAYNTLVGKPEGKRPCGRPRWEIGWKAVDWMHLAEDRGWWWALVNTVKDIQVL
jgi:hypothetical protein